MITHSVCIGRYGDRILVSRASSVTFGVHNVRQVWLRWTPKRFQRLVEILRRMTFSVDPNALNVPRFDVMRFSAEWIEPAPKVDDDPLLDQWIEDHAQ